MAVLAAYRSLQDLYWRIIMVYVLMNSMNIFRGLFGKILGLF